MGEQHTIMDIVYKSEFKTRKKIQQHKYFRQIKGANQILSVPTTEEKKLMTRTQNIHRIK